MRLLTRHQVAERLAMSLRAVDELRRRGQLPHVKLGGRVGVDGVFGKGAAIRFAEKDLDHWLKLQTSQP